MGQSRSRRLLQIFAVLSTLAFAVSACSSSENTDADKPLPAEAQQVMTSAIETMFSWNPVEDPGPGAAFARAAQFLTPAANSANQAFGQESVAGWEKWKKEGSKLTAEATIGDSRPSSAPADTDTAVTRSVDVKQSVVGTDGGTTETFSFTLDQVEATEADGKWLVQSISNIDRAGGGLCPAGEIEASGSCAPKPSTTTVTTAKPAPAPAPGPAPGPAPAPIIVTTTPGPTIPGPSCPPPMIWGGSYCVCPPWDLGCNGTTPDPLCPDSDPYCRPPVTTTDPPFDPNNCDPGLMCLKGVGPNRTG